MPNDPRSSHPPDEAAAPYDRGRSRSANDDLFDDFGDRADSDRAPGPDHDGVAALLDAQLQARPVATLLLAVAAGWIVGKILR